MVTEVSPDPARRGPHALITTLASLGLTASLLVGFAQFWYSNEYLPGAVGVALNITTELKEQAPSNTRADLRTFNGTLKVKNISTTKVQVVSSLYYVARVRQRGSSPRTGLKLPDYLNRYAPQELECGGPYPASRYRTYDDEVKMLEMGPAYSPITYFEPGEEFTTQFLFQTPEAELSSKDLLRFHAELTVAKGRRLTLATDGSQKSERIQFKNPSKVRCLEGLEEYLVTEWPIQPLSQIGELTAGPQALNVIHFLGWGGRDSEWFPSLVVCINPRGHLNRELQRESELDPTKICPISEKGYHRKARESYGLTATESNEFLVPTERPKPHCPDPTKLDKLSLRP